MAGRSNCTVYVGNLDERVSDRVLYDILIQAGRVVDLHIPRDKETSRPKGFAFAQYETEEVADYAVKLFSGLVTLHNRTLKFAVSGQDKPSPSSGSTIASASNLSHKSRFYADNQHPQVPVYPGLVNQSNGYGSHLGSYTNEYNQKYFGTNLDRFNYSRSGHFDSRNPISYPCYDRLT